jgi:hypothetical protein
VIGAISAKKSDIYAFLGEILGVMRE